MCPLCLTAAALFVSGVTSTGGVTALVVSKLHRKSRAKLAGSINQTAQRSNKPKPQETNMDRPKVVSRDEWLTARKALLAREKKFTQERDALAAERRRLPMVRVDKQHGFETPSGKQTLADLFGGRSQLAVYHFMFGPDWKEGCPSCSMAADHFDGNAIHLAQRDVTLVAISRAPLAQIEAFKSRMGWRFNWVSSNANDFNRDYRVSFPKDELSKGKVYNFDTSSFPSEEAPGLSVFYKDPAGDVFHTYSTYGRGLEGLLGAYTFLDLVPKGRDEDALPYPMAWVRHHDKYSTAHTLASRLYTGGLGAPIFLLTCAPEHTYWLVC